MIPADRDAALLALTLAQGLSDPAVLVPRVSDLTIGPSGSLAAVAEAAAALIHEVVAATREQVSDDSSATWRAIGEELSATLALVIERAGAQAGLGGVNALYRGVVEAVLDGGREL